MLHAIVGGDIHLRRRLRNLVHDRIHRGGAAIGQKHRAGLGVQRLNLAHAVVFLVGAGEFVLADAVAVVIGNRGRSHDAGLAVRPHHQPVDIIVSPGVALEHAVPEHPVKILPAPGVHRRTVRVGARGQINLGLGDMQKTPRPALCASARLLGAQNIVGRRGDIRGAAGRRAQASERTNQ